ncbi:MAG: hypothetical protein Q8Q03_01140 [bacterium]|nr:hypothetical protein [bacterium]
MGPKNIILIVMAILIVAGAFVFAEYRNNQIKKAVYSAPVVSGNDNFSTPEILIENSDKDSDGDGLKDWEEALLVTTSSSTPSANLTPTDRLARDFFARYMELNQMGLSGDAQSQQEMVGQVLKNGIVLSQPEIYDLKDIRTSSDNSAEYIKKYGNDVGAIFNSNQIRGRDEAVISKESAEKEDPEILREIDPIISAYKRIIDGLLKIPAPPAMASMHLNLINSVSKFLFTAEAFRQSNADAMKGLQAASSYLDNGKSLIDSLQTIKKYLASKNISYSQNEPGYMFYR